MFLGGITLAQTQHTVLRGETKESIARKYNVQVSALEQANPLLKDDCFVGMALSIPAAVPTTRSTAPVSKNTNQNNVRSRNDEAQEYWDEACKAFDKDHYSRAAKYWSIYLDLGGKDRASANYNLGLCYYNQEKFKKARDYFSWAASEYPSWKTKEKRDAEQMKKQCDNTISDRSARRRKLWGGVALAAAGAALAVGSVAISTAMAPTYSTSYTPSYSSSALSDYSSDQYYARAAAEADMQARQGMAQANALALSVSRMEASQKMQQAQNEYNANSQAIKEVGDLMSDWWQMYQTSTAVFSPDDSFKSYFYNKKGRWPNDKEMMVFGQLLGASAPPGTDGAGNAGSGNSRFVENVHSCKLCGGKKVIDENNVPTSFGISAKKEYCSTCGRDMYTTHYHISCPGCKGKGFYTTMERE